MLYKSLIVIFISGLIVSSCTEKAKRKDIEIPVKKAVTLPPFDTSKTYSNLFLEPSRLDSFIARQQLEGGLGDQTAPNIANGSTGVSTR